MRAGAERRGIEVDEDALAEGTKAVEEQIERESDAFVASGELWDDGIIDPRDTRTVLGIALSAACSARGRGLAALRRLPDVGDDEPRAPITQGARRQPRRDRAARLRRLPAARDRHRRRLLRARRRRAVRRRGRRGGRPRRHDRRRVLSRRRPSCSTPPRRTGADAVHPGYGFLAENADFARAVGDAGLIWIGPPPEAIEAMGSKVRARALMEEAGVPVVPGCELGDGADVARRGRAGRLPAARQGIGRRRRQGDAARSPPPDELEGAVEGARREAESAFGDATVFLERHLQRPRHIEIQLLADTHGHHGQPRRARVLDPAPPSEGRRGGPVARRRRRAARAARRRRGGRGRGGRLRRRRHGRVPARRPTASFHFLEMNTRLQVEHPVTEMVLGIDLVAEQLRIAAGEPLGRRAREPVIERPRDRGSALRRGPGGRLPARRPAPSSGSRSTAPSRSRRRRGSREPVDLRLDSGVEAGERRQPALRPDARQADRLGAEPRGGGRAAGGALGRRARSTASSPIATCSSGSCAIPDFARRRHRHRLPRARATACVEPLVDADGGAPARRRRRALPRWPSGAPRRRVLALRAAGLPQQLLRAAADRLRGRATASSRSPTRSAATGSRSG